MKEKVKGSMGKIKLKDIGLFLVLIIMCIVLSFLSPVFMTYDNIMNVIRQISITAIIAVGMFMIIVTGGIDLSVGQVAALTGVSCGIFVINMKMPMLVGMILALLIAVLCGFLNGILITYGKLPAFIATLATSQVTKGLAFTISGGIPISGFPEGFTTLGRGYLGPIPWPVIILFVVYLIMWDVIKRTKFGVHVFAIGGSEVAAFLSGIKITKTKIMVYTIGGLLTGVSGLILSSRLNSGSPNVGSTFTFDAVTACVLGGTSMAGGEGNLLGVLVGSIFVGILTNGMSLLNVDAYVQMMVQGIVLGGAMLLQTCVIQRKKQ